jgi:hypothetical protein
MLSDPRMAQYPAGHIFRRNRSKQDRLSGAVQISIHLVKFSRSRTKAYAGVIPQAPIDLDRNAPNVSGRDLLANDSIRAGQSPVGLICSVSGDLLLVRTISTRWRYNDIIIFKIKLYYSRMPGHSLIGRNFFMNLIPGYFNRSWLSKDDM